MAMRPETSTGGDLAGPPIAPAAATSRFVTVSGLRLHLLDYGTTAQSARARVMLCVHGGAANGHWFDFIAGAFTPGHHVMALDLRGHGDSAWATPPAYTYGDYAKEVDGVAAALDLRDFVLVGHSMGGMVSLLYASTYPGRVQRLVVVDSTMNLSPERINAMREVGNRQGGSYATQEELVARYRLRPGNALAPLEVQHYIARQSSRQWPDGAWRHKFDRGVYATRESMDGMPCWERIKIPALLVKGGRSQRITPQIAADVQARCPQVEMAEVPDSDHHVTLDNPAGFVQALKAFLARHP